ncbi:hypothetical protein Psi01_12850 [Planobispora siamensis]|uniref:Secreted protein n=1 Tax=Planobispora siamensis TaxID=936338 RepID=A0A8J3SDQ6_9ACTN|nr:hypothetical protein Psi01_12850 [Planobispora siamensis]
MSTIVPIMKIARIAVVVAAGAGVLGAGAAAVEAVMPGYGCTADDNRFAASLGEIGILKARPHGAMPYESERADCEPDDRISSAGRSYRFPGPRADVLAFYRDAAVMDGWDPGWGSVSALAENVCASKLIGDEYVHLSVAFSDSSGKRGHADYRVNVSGGYGGGRPCG